MLGPGVDLEIHVFAAARAARQNGILSELLVSVDDFSTAGLPGAGGGRVDLFDGGVFRREHRRGFAAHVRAAHHHDGQTDADRWQFVADGMKIDLARATITVTDDPKHPEFRAVTWTVNEYWGAIY
ncbi:hypothetical protein [Nocardia sp. NPDC059195]|uniref:hypothetical protein n=1 Tax=Nocardia sp. NPDC059195 TaxID=3346765 RepID=UPI0036837177